MANYRRRTLREVQAGPALEPLRGGRAMRRSAVSAVHAAGDRVLSHGRRILATVGLHGAKTWHMSDAAPGMSQTKPDDSTERVCIRTPPYALTPGHFVRVSLVCLPSGDTEYTPGGGSWSSSGPKGQVKVEVEYVNATPTTSTQTRILDLPNSKLDNGSQPTGAAAAWANLHVVETGPIYPADLDDPATLAAWADNSVTAEITVSYVGSPRVVDLVVYEEPHALAYDLVAGGWIAPMLSTSGGAGLGAIPGVVPTIKRSAADPGHGAEIVCDAARRLCQEVGPILMFHSAWNEDAQPVADTETAYDEVINTGFIEVMLNVSVLALVPPTPYPAWSTAGASHALRVQESEHTVVLRGRVGVVPVRCYIYGAMSTASGSPTATVQFTVSSSNLVEVAIPAGTSYAWHSAPGFLHCGVGAQQEMVMHVRAKCSTGGVGFRWRYAAVAFDGTINAP